MKRLTKGAYKFKPTRPKYTYTWDPQLVLNYVAERFPNLSLSLKKKKKKITKKLIILLALCTAHGVQTLSLIKL